MKSLFWIVFIFFVTENCRTTALIVESMDTAKSIITVEDPRYYSYFSSGILKSHIGFSYRTNYNKTLTLTAPSGCGITVAIRLIDLRPRNMDKLTLFTPSSVPTRTVYSNPSFFRNRSYDANERITINEPSGRLAVNFQTDLGSSSTYDGFELVYTAYTNEIICSYSEFRCWNRRCIASSLTCDGHNHCGDRSDQVNCIHPPKKRHITTIAIGSILVVIALVCLIIFAIRKSKRTRTVIHQPLNPPVSVYPTSQLQPGSYYPPPPPPYTPYNNQGHVNAGYQ